MPSRLRAADGLKTLLGLRVVRIGPYRERTFERLLDLVDADAVPLAFELVALIPIEARNGDG